ncbi:hypothetical protein EPYR_02381 [Erwinia pyrifoliae DSM 12163]|nr:hypothetical protein EPYR_02381 [Erwinia pyrifoliae DSM 12163]
MTGNIKRIENKATTLQINILTVNFNMDKIHITDH